MSVDSGVARKECTQSACGLRGIWRDSHISVISTLQIYRGYYLFSCHKKLGRPEKPKGDLNIKHPLKLTESRAELFDLGFCSKDTYLKLNMEPSSCLFLCSYLLISKGLLCMRCLMAGRRGHLRWSWTLALQSYRTSHTWGQCTTWKHWRCEANPSFSSISHLLFAYLSLNTKPTHSLVKEGRQQAHWSQAQPPAEPSLPTSHTFSEKRLERGGGHPWSPYSFQCLPCQKSCHFLPHLKWSLRAEVQAHCCLAYTPCTHPKPTDLQPQHLR